MSTEPQTTESDATESFEFDFETPGGLSENVTVEAESRDAALDTLADWNWYEVGVEDTSGAWDHETVVAPDRETAEARGEQQAEDAAFNKIDNASAYDTTKLGPIAEVNDDWAESREEWGDDWILRVEVEGVEAVGDGVAPSAMEELVPYIVDEDSMFEIENRPEDPDPEALGVEATRSAAWVAESDLLDTETRPDLSLSGTPGLCSGEFDTLVERVEDALGDEWVGVHTTEYQYREQWGPHSVPEDVQNPHGPGVTFWVSEDTAFVFGHELTVEAPSGDIEYARVHAGQALVFEGDDHSLSVHPYKANPESWEVFGEGGVKASYEGTPEDGVFEWVVEVDGDRRRYRVRSESISEVVA